MMHLRVGSAIMIILFHDIGVPPLWILAILLPISLASFALIIYGAVFLARKWKNFNTGLKIVTALAPLVIFAGYSVFGFLAMLPFGLLAGLPALFFFDTRNTSIEMALASAGSLLNALGFAGLIGLIRLIAKRLGFFRTPP